MISDGIDTWKKTLMINITLGRKRESQMDNFDKGRKTFSTKAHHKWTRKGNRALALMD